MHFFLASLFCFIVLCQWHATRLFKKCVLWLDRMFLVLLLLIKIVLTTWGILFLHVSFWIVLLFLRRIPLPIYNNQMTICQIGKMIINYLGNVKI